MTEKLNELKKKSFPVVIEGKTYYLRFDLNALALLEEKFGSAEEATRKAAEGSAIAIRCFLWAGLKSNHPDMTEEDVGALIDLANLAEVSEEINKAFEQAMPSEGGTEAKNGEAPIGAISDFAPEKQESAKENSGV